MREGSSRSDRARGRLGKGSRALRKGKRGLGKGNQPVCYSSTHFLYCPYCHSRWAFRRKPGGFAQLPLPLCVRKGDFWRQRGCPRRPRECTKQQKPLEVVIVIIVYIISFLSLQQNILGASINILPFYRSGQKGALDTRTSKKV